MAGRTFSEPAEEILEWLYVQTVENKGAAALTREIDAEVMRELQEAGAVEPRRGQIALTSAGLAAGRSVIRRHRLAERLLADVIGSTEASMHDEACRFEHILSDGLEEQICTLLGHPKVCPHGRPIPEGECCRKRRVVASPVIVPLSRMKKGEVGRVAYINAEVEILNKLMAMGVLPGATIELIQSFPSFVFQAGQSQFAVDREIAETISVRREH